MIYDRRPEDRTGWIDSVLHGLILLAVLIQLCNALVVVSRLPSAVVYDLDPIRVEGASQLPEIYVYP